MSDQFDEFRSCPDKLEGEIDSAELARLRQNSERWEWFLRSGHLMVIDFDQRLSGTLRSTKEAAVDAAIAAERGK